MTTAPETPTNATDLAERALIGALLADPSRVRDVRDWLRPSDIHQPKARAIYHTLTELHRHGRTVTIRELPMVIAADDGTHPPVTAQDLHAYLQATPAASQQLGTQHLRSNHVVYARRVLEAAASAALNPTSTPPGRRQPDWPTTPAPDPPQQQGHRRHR